MVGESETQSRIGEQYRTKKNSELQMTSSILRGDIRCSNTLGRTTESSTEPAEVLRHNGIQGESRHTSPSSNSPAPTLPLSTQKKSGFQT